MYQGPDYISMDELVERIPYPRQTIYSMITGKVWIKRLHYFKSTPRKLIFYGPAIEAWIRSEEG